MAWKLRYAGAVSHEMKRFDRSDALFILASLDRFAASYDPSYEAGLMKMGKLKRLRGEWEGFFRLRLRAFRVIYRKFDHDLLILVVRIAHRREAYRI